MVGWKGLSRQDAAGLLSDLIRCASPDPPGDETKIARFLAPALERLGFAVACDEFAPNRFNILARVPGAGARPALVFSAHMDTLPVGSGRWTRDPFGGEITEGRVWGRGACDMKSGLAAMVSAALAIARDGKPLQGDLILAFTGGESSKCLGAQHLAETRALEGAGAILVSEPTSLAVVTAEKAALWLRATAHGVAGHLSGGIERGNGGRSAILDMMRFLSAIPDLLPDDVHHLLGKATVNIGTIAGGTAINLMPDLCTAEIDLRLLPGQDTRFLRNRLHTLAGEHISLDLVDIKPAVETAADHPFAALCLREASAERGLDLRPEGVAYFSDAAILSPAFGLPMVIIGPGTLGGSGGVDESCAIDDLETAARIYRRIARAYLG